LSGLDNKPKSRLAWINNYFFKGKNKNKNKNKEYMESFLSVLIKHLNSKMLGPVGPDSKLLVPSRCKATLIGATRVGPVGPNSKLLVSSRCKATLIGATRGIIQC